jgi:hypothetical protein
VAATAELEHMRLDRGLVAWVESEAEDEVGNRKDSCSWNSHQVVQSGGRPPA